MEQSNELINKLFSSLDAWRHYPSYQLERRADIFFAIYLPDFIQKKYGAEVQALIPEFPVRVGTIVPEVDINKSYKIDYVARLKGIDRVLFIELKTDNQSRRPEQDSYLKKAREQNIPSLVKGIARICQATNAKQKYSHLETALERAGFIQTGFKVLESLFDIEIIYLQPKAEPNDPTVVGFVEFADFVAEHSDPLSQRFAESLRRWATEKAGTSASAT
jgi:hypothetical protein